MFGSSKGLFRIKKYKTGETKKTQEYDIDVLCENREMEKHTKHIDSGVWNVGIITQDSQNMRYD